MEPIVVDDVDVPKAVLIQLRNVKVCELFDVVMLLVGLTGMYHGIDIDHPVYALLFCNIGFAFLVTIVNLASLGKLVSGILSIIL